MSKWDVEYDEWGVDNTPKKGNPRIDKDRYCKKNRIGKNKYGSHEYASGECARCKKIDPKRKRSIFAEDTSNDNIT